MTTGALHVVGPSRPLPPPISLEEAVRLSRLAGEAQEGRPGYVQDALAVDFGTASDEQFFGPQRTARADLPDPAAWSARITHALLEVMTGVRPAPQVVRWTTPEVYAVVARRSALAARRAAEGRPRAPGSGWGSGGFGSASPPTASSRRQSSSSTAPACGPSR